jgi:hypothetical protein
MYQIEVTGAHTMNINGTQADPATTAIPLALGENWIGYIPTFTSTVPYAMEGANSQNGDQLKSQALFTQYYSAGASGVWMGTLQNMQPGSGYIYTSTSTTARTFYYPSIPSKDVIIEYQPRFEPKQAPRVGRYANNMTLTAVVVKDNEEMRGDWIEIEAFSGDECRGSAQLQYIAILDKYIGFLMIHGKGAEGDENEIITLKAYDHITGQEYSVKNAPFRFITDAIMGNPGTPYIVDLGAANVEQLTMDNGQLTIYPNPTDGQLTIENGELRIENVMIYVMMGRTVRANLCVRPVETHGRASLQFDISSLPTGAYFLRIQTSPSFGGGKGEVGVITQKIIKQ